MSFFFDSIYLGYQRKHIYPVDNQTLTNMHIITDTFVAKLMEKGAKDIQHHGSYISFGSMQVNGHMHLSAGELTISADSNSINVNYRIKFNVVIGLLALIPMLFIVSKVWHYDVEAAIISFVVFFVVGWFSLYYPIFRFDGFVTSSVRTVTDTHVPIEISNEQRNWIKDDARCPACGNLIGKNDSNCLDCGLFLGSNNNVAP
jgi:hypothetical protein